MRRICLQQRDLTIPDCSKDGRERAKAHQEPGSLQQTAERQNKEAGKSHTVYKSGNVNKEWPLLKAHLLLKGE